MGPKQSRDASLRQAPQTNIRIDADQQGDYFEAKIPTSSTGIFGTPYQAELVSRTENANVTDKGTFIQIFQREDQHFSTLCNSGIYSPPNQGIVPTQLPIGIHRVCNVRIHALEDPSRILDDLAYQTYNCLVCQIPADTRQYTHNSLSVHEIADQILTVFEFLHSHGVAYGPGLASSQLGYSPSTKCLITYDLQHALSFVHWPGSFKTYSESSGILSFTVGDIELVSTDFSKNIGSVRGDLQQLFHLLLQLSAIKLPWSSLEDPDETVTAKRWVGPDTANGVTGLDKRLFSNMQPSLPEWVQTMGQLVYSLDYDSTNRHPGKIYDKIRACLPTERTQS